MTQADLTFIDVETTGLSPVRDRIIEIGILRMRRGKIVRTFTSLVNPECSLPPEITMLTGITARELEEAPLFSRIADEVASFFTDSLFVAHNVRFDYAFVRAEFMRLERTFSSEKLCTAKLSRVLFPRFKHHSLDDIIDRFGIACTLRHRAFDDAKVLAEFYRLSKKQFGAKVLADAMLHVTKTAALPKTISPDTVRGLPESPGVYIFYGESGQPLYIGKSVNIRDRVRSHFYDFSQSAKEARIFTTIASVEAIKTSGELGAFLLESRLIKERSPLYNRKLRKSASLCVLCRTTDRQGYDGVEVLDSARLSSDDIPRILAIYRTRGQMKRALIDLARGHKLCMKLLGLEKSTGPCFGSQIALCNGACQGRELPARYNMRFTEAFFTTRVRQWPFPGPIGIREGDTTYLVDNWCLLGTADDREHRSPPQFDYDTYRILSSHLLRRAKMREITVISDGHANRGL